MTKVHSHNSKSIKDFLNLGGTMRDHSIAKERAKEFTQDEDILQIVDMYYILLADTNYLRSEVFAFYVEGLSYDEIVVKFDIKKNYVRTLIYNENKRLFKDLGGYDIYSLLQTNKFTKLTTTLLNKVLSVLLYERDDIEIREKEITIGKAMEVDELNFLDERLSVQPKSIKIDRSFNTKVSDISFNRLMDIVKSLSTHRQEVLISKVDERFLGYLSYLYTNPEGNLTTEDVARKKILLQLLGGDNNGDLSQ